jgi:hypothetical protein
MAQLIEAVALATTSTFDGLVMVMDLEMIPTHPPWLTDKSKFTPRRVSGESRLAMVPERPGMPWVPDNPGRPWTPCRPVSP